MRPGPPPVDHDARAFDALRALYAGLEDRVRAAGPRCDLSGRCCRFRETGHALLATELEARFAAAGARGETAPAGAGPEPKPRQPVPPRFPLRTQPVRPDEPADLYEPCPFLQDAACRLRGHRPLGCRVFFCDPAYQAGAMSPLHEEFHARIARLHDELGIPYRYGPFARLMKALLASPPAGRDPAEAPAAPPAGRL